MRDRINHPKTRLENEGIATAIYDQPSCLMMYVAPHIMRVACQARLRARLKRVCLHPTV